MINAYLIKFPFETGDLLGVGVGDVQARWDGVVKVDVTIPTIIKIVEVWLQFTSVIENIDTLGEWQKCQINRYSIRVKVSYFKLVLSEYIRFTPNWQPFAIMHLSDLAMATRDARCSASSTV